MNEGSDLAWTCEAFGIPEVTYAWLRNGEVLNAEVRPAAPPSDLVRGVSTECCFKTIRVCFILKKRYTSHWRTGNAFLTTFSGICS